MKKYIRGKNFVGNYEIRKAIENEPEEITCEKCKKHFILTPIYDFRGWRSEPDENYYDEDENVF